MLFNTINTISGKMDKINDLSKVLKVLETVLNDCLSVNRDDTLIEKLLTFLRHDLYLIHEDKQLVLKCLEKSIDLSLNELKANNDCNDWPLIAIKLRICGSLLADKELFVCQQNCLQLIEQILPEMVTTNKSSLKFAYFRCLNDLSDHSFGLNWILRTTYSNSTNIKSFPQLLWYYLNRSETRFVEREVMKLFVRLVDHSLTESVLCEQIDETLRKLISSINTSNIDIMKEILITIQSKHQFIQKFGIIEVLVNCIDFWSQQFSDKLFILSQVLGLCVDTNEKAVEIIDKLLSKNDLISIIGFLTDFIVCNSDCDQNLLKKWFYYTIGSFATNSKLIDCFDDIITDKTLLDRLSNKTTNDYSLKQILRFNFNRLNDKQIVVMFEIISKHIQLNYEKREMRKTIIQCLNVLETICLKSKSDIQTIQSFLQIYSDLLQIVSNDYKLIVLKSLRVLTADRVWPQTCDSTKSALIKVMTQLNAILNNFQYNQNDWEITDSVLEVVYSLLLSLTRSQIKLMTICPQLMTTVLSIWTSNEDNMSSTIRSTFISVVLIIHLNLSNEDLNQLFDTKDNLKSLSSLLSTDELMVRFIIIKTFEENICSLVDIERQNQELFQQMIEKFCELSINDLDEDLQTNALNLLHSLFQQIVKQKQFCWAIDLFFKSYYFHSIYHLVNSSEHLFKVKQICVEIIEYIQNQMISLNVGENGPTLDSFTNTESILNTNVDKRLTQIISVDRKKIFEFIIKFDIKTFKENETSFQPKLNILDDILSVSLIDTNILIDCY